MGKVKKESKFLKYLKELKRKEKLLLFISILIFTFIAIELFIVKPLKNKGNLLQEESNTLNGEKIDLLNEINREDELETKLNTITYNYNKILKTLPKTERQADVIKNLVEVSKNSNIKLMDITFENQSQVLGDKLYNESLNNNTKNTNITEENKNLNKNSVMANNALVVVNGKFKDIINFVKKIENQKRKININEIKIEKNNMDLSGNNDMNNILQASIKIEYYNLNYKENEKYDFNKGTYGKENYFK